MHATPPMGEIIGPVCEPVFSVYHLGLGGHTQVVSFVKKCLYLLQHLLERSHPLVEHISKCLS